MRIVGGDLRGRNLFTPEGKETRPTTDRVREAVFNVLAHSDLLPGGLEGARVLDLFAGTGALGLEALSRGASFAVFVETDGSARAAIRENIEAFDLMGQTHLLRRDATGLGEKPSNIKSPFDLVFLDPPYKQGLGPKAIKEASTHGWLSDHACLVFEVTTKEELPEIEGFTLSDSRTYGQSKIGFYSSSEA